MPGRGDSPADIASVTLEDCAQKIVDDVNGAGFGNVVLVGHSIAGLYVTDAAIRLGPERVRRLVYVAALIPRNGRTGADALPWPLKGIVSRAGAKGTPIPPLNRTLATYVFCNGMPAAQRNYTLSNLCAESPHLGISPVDRSGLRDEIPRAWVLTTKDRTLSRKLQRQFIANLGGVDHVFAIQSGHDVMISKPDELSAALLQCLP